MRGTNVTEETFIRHLPYSVVKYLSVLLDVDNLWQRMVVKIPKKLDSPNFECRYSHLQVRLFEDKAKRPDGSPTRTIIDDWGTQNTKVKHLLKVLIESALFDAADYVSVKVLNGEKVPRRVAAESSDIGGQTGSIPAPTWGDPVKQKHADDSLKNFKSVDKEKFPNKALSEIQQNNLSGLDQPVLYDESMLYRIPSYESGGDPSVLLQGNPSRLSDPPSKTLEDETLLVRDRLNYLGPTSSVPSERVPLESSTSVSPSLPAPVSTRIPSESSSELPSSSSRIPSESEDMTIDKKSSALPDLTQIMPYGLLKQITKDFDDRSVPKGGRIVGCGGFGTVFLGVFQNGYRVAVKCIKKEMEDSEKQFETELQALIKYRHENIVSLLGYSIDGPSKCLVYEFMPNGSLEDRLALKGGTRPLTVRQRLDIIKGTAHGIHFLNKQGTVHRDIKSANVLLDKEFKPKVGDFATVRRGPRGCTTTAVGTSLVIGTSAYLAPEALHFDVSTKLDSYSFGIVILEVITGLPAIDQDREEKDIKAHVEEHDVIMDLVDLSAGPWDEEVVNKLVSVSERCSNYKKKKRVNVEDVIDELISVCS